MTSRLLQLLDAAPLAVNVTDIEGRLVFSDIPERLVEKLRAQLGAPFDAQHGASADELVFIDALPERDAAPARHTALAASGELARRIAQTPLPSRETRAFMIALNTSDEAVLGRTGVLYLECPKGCHFCQYRGFRSQPLTVEQAADYMLAFQEAGADNVQWLSPSGHTAFLLHALARASAQGFTLPIVHKAEGEDSAADLALLDGVIDVYVPDAKFIRDEAADTIGLGRGYGARLERALTEMVRQVGPLTRTRGTRLAHSGVLVRHLLMPAGVDEAALVFALLARIDAALPVHLMTLYQPFDRARTMPGLDRPTSESEAAAAIAALRATTLPAMIR